MQSKCEDGERLITQHVALGFMREQREIQRWLMKLKNIWHQLWSHHLFSYLQPFKITIRYSTGLFKEGTKQRRWTHDMCEISGWPWKQVQFFLVKKNREAILGQGTTTHRAHRVTGIWLGALGQVSIGNKGAGLAVLPPSYFFCLWVPSHSWTTESHTCSLPLGPVLCPSRWRVKVCPQLYLFSARSFALRFMPLQTWPSHTCKIPNIVFY